MKRGIRRDPFRKRKLGGRAKKVREPTAVNSFYREASLPSVWASLRRREMVRSGARPGQVLSSGRHTGPAKLTNGKKATYLRKIPRFNADSGYSIHSDSESQAETVHGLDGCASLLRDILRNEDSGSETAYLENRSNSRPLESKRYGSKKKRHEKHTIPLVVQKETSSSDNKKQIPNEASARSERDTSDLEQNWSLQDHYRMYSPIIYQALCEHVQTQMSLMNDLTSKNIPNGIPAVPCHAPSHSESQATPHSSYGLCTSTPVWSLQRPPCPPKVHSEVQTDGNSQFASQEDSEIQRLITEMEACISVLPTVSGNTDIQVEIALAMQPLRSENAQLRRQLRILNQQLREQQKTQKPSGAVDCNLELFSLQSLNMSLQNQLEESLKSQELLQSKNEELLKVIENQKDENKKFSSIFKDKDQTILENKQQYDIEITRIKIELEEALVNVKSSQFKLETAEKENQILGITLRQRDAEVTRLRELTRSTPEKKSPLSKRLSPQPQIRAATTQLVSNSGLAVSGKENKLCTPVICSSSTKEAEDAPEKLSRASDMKDTQLLKKIKEAIGKIPAATKEPEEQTACHGPSGCLSNSLQVKGNTVCDGSVFTSDLMSDWSISSFSTFTSRDEQDFRNGLAALDANIARLQKSLRTGLLEK
eukprot:XP_006713796.1 coiled-coil domain-containing protein 14 isoform X9 [Homo sapiens]